MPSPLIKKTQETYQLSTNFWTILILVIPFTFFALTILCYLAVAFLATITQTMALLWLTRAFLVLAIAFPIVSSVLTYWIWRSLKALERDASRSSEPAD